MTLEEIDNVEGLVNGLEKIELPNQLVAVLADPLLQKLMLLKPAAESHQRVGNWVVSWAQELTERNSDSDSGGFLEILLAYVSATKVRQK